MDNFYKNISKQVNSYDGKYKDIIKTTPFIYRLLCNLFVSTSINSKTRADLLTVIGYYVIPDDIMNEDIMGPKGFIDDFMLSVSILKKIEIDYDLETISQYWTGDVDITIVLNDYFQIIKDEYSYEYNKIKELLPSLFTYK